MFRRLGDASCLMIVVDIADVLANMAALRVCERVSRAMLILECVLWHQRRWELELIHVRVSIVKYVLHC